MFIQCETLVPQDGADDIRFMAGLEPGLLRASRRVISVPPRVIEETFASCPSEDLHQYSDEEVDLVAEGIQTLSPEQRAVIDARFYSNKTLREIAREQTCSFCEVKSIQRQAYQRLKKFLKSHKTKLN
jgi:RNA polymerase sigma factor (sigma-70 family)